MSDSSSSAFASSLHRRGAAGITWPRIIITLVAIGVECFQVCGAVEYFYGIGTDANLYQFSIDTSANSFFATAKLNLGGFISGYGNGTRYNEIVSGLGVDASSGDIYFNYSYNTSSTSTSGPMTVVPYIYQRIPGASDYKNPYPLGSAITSANLPATDTASGWMTGGTFYNGVYYTTLQGKDTLVGMPVTGTTTKSYASITSYTDWDHSSITAMWNGDFVIGGSGTIYGSTVLNNQNNFYRQTLANATASSGGMTTYNVDSTIPFNKQGALEIAGLGDSSRLYGVTTGGTKQVYLVSNIDSIPTFTPLTGSLTIPITDLSVILNAPLQIPESAAAAGVLGISFGMVLEWILRRMRSAKIAGTVQSS